MISGSVCPQTRLARSRWSHSWTRSSRHEVSINIRQLFLIPNVRVTNVTILDPHCLFQSDSWRGASYKTQSQNGKKEFTFSWGVIGSVMGVTEPNHLGQRTKPPLGSFNINEVPTDVFPFSRATVQYVQIIASPQQMQNKCSAFYH